MPDIWASKSLVPTDNHPPLKVLSCEMDLAKSGLIRKVLIKGRGAEICVRHWPLDSLLSITQRDGAKSLKGSHWMREGKIFLKISAPLSFVNTYRLSLFSAGSISMDSTFKSLFAEEIFFFSL